MSLYKCVTEDRLVVFNYRPIDSLFPCFVGGENEYACSVAQHECGIDVAGLSEGEETRPFLEVARDFGGRDVLSKQDVIEYINSQGRPEGIRVFDYYFNRNRGIDRFLEKAEEIVGRYQSLKKDPSGPEPTKPCSSVRFRENVSDDMRCFQKTGFDDNI